MAPQPHRTLPRGQIPSQAARPTTDHPLLDRIACQAGRKVHVIADRHPVHRSKAVRAWLETTTDRIELHLMPGYSPEFNPDELLNADLKRNVNASRAHTLDRLTHETRRFLRRRQRQPHIVRPHVRYAAM